MPKQRGPLKIVGTLEDINFYKLKKGYAVRMKGGVDKDRILSEAKFARTRENMSEFGLSATAGKYLRKAAAGLTLSAKDNTSVSRLTQVMTRIKYFDNTSPRGKRRVEIGIQNPEGIALLKNFNFNDEAPLYAILNAPYTLDNASGEVEIPVLITAKNLNYPSAATHVSFMSAFMVIDFATGEFQVTESPVVNLPINLVSTQATLTPADVPSGTGPSIYLLGIQFFQEINGVQYPLSEGAYNTLSIIEAAI
ncbi:hypothetical protein [Aequorivita echinoideorum]|uniref:Uncharacterized protein n=1 Tax=Aequorivita echinoideorum TaxID=1549647 RepID=A0ABS5S405_9FLAO|nr:hypothetical protein [Aequorivita echinoideorum]MBT0607940.1 hypothetical protein [Aequorivita echinoideorum]